MAWVEARGIEERKGYSPKELKCKCGSKRFRVVKEASRRKEKTKTAPRLRYAAYCLKCETPSRIISGVTG